MEESNDMTTTKDPTASPQQNTNNTIIRQPTVEKDDFGLFERCGNYVKLLPPDVKTRDMTIP